MKNDDAIIERLVESITRQVLLTLANQEQRSQSSEHVCGEECADGLCVQLCLERLQPVMAAGADRITAGLGAQPADAEMAQYIDHTLLKAEATPDQIAQLCYEARRYGFASVCLNPTHVKLAAQLLSGSTVQVCTVIGFPLGATAAEVKSFETQQAIDDGATEIDMVINIGALKAKDYDTMVRDVRAVVRVAHAKGAIVKVIIEAALLTDEEKVAACLISKEAGADFVKTSTGFGPGGATVADVALMRRVVGPRIGVKAAGGIKTFEDARAMVSAGATRIGASAGVKITSASSEASNGKAVPSSAGSY